LLFVWMNSLLPFQDIACELVLFQLSCCGRMLFDVHNDPSFTQQRAFHEDSC